MLFLSWLLLCGGGGLKFSLEDVNFLSPRFFLFPFVSFEFSFLKRLLLLNSGSKGRHFHLLWARSPCTGVRVIAALAVVFLPAALMLIAAV